MVCSAAGSGIACAVWVSGAVAAALATALVFPGGADAALPGRDGLIAFKRFVGPQPGQIYLVRPDGSGLRRLTHRRQGAGAPAWSPDGRRIAFEGTPPRGGVHVYVKRLGRGGERDVTRGTGTFHDPTWSPGGRGIAVVRLQVRAGVPSDSIVVVAPNGGRMRTVYESRGQSLSDPSWSPDSRTIAFVQTDTDLQGADPNLYTVPAAGGTPQRLTDTGSQVQPDWSPDGRLLAYAWDPTGGWNDIRVIHPDATGDAPITDDLNVPDGSPAWAPSGTRIAISRLGRIWTIAPDGSGLRQVTNGPAGAGDDEPSWQPR
jgi:dipeptidyl aminopeptidase/acylaminoacyl peptidase